MGRPAAEGFGVLDASLDFPHGFDVLAQLDPIVRPHASLKAIDFVEDRVEEAPLPA